MDTRKFSEKRALPRLLCDDSFSTSTVKTSVGTFKLMSINYHSKGMALFTTDRIPLFEKGVVSFCYKKKDHTSINIIELPFILRHLLETENGSQYGVKFEFGENGSKSQIPLVKEIEKILEDGHLEDRYRLADS